MIAIDIDGVVCNSAPWFIKEIEKGIGRRIKHTIPRTFEFDADIKNSIIDKHIKNTLIKYKDDIEPHDYTRTLMALLMVEYHQKCVHFVTARSNGDVAKATKYWLNKYFNGLNYEIHFLGDLGNKQMWMYDNEFNVIIEDRLKTVNNVASPFTSTYLVNRDWNVERYTSPYVKRVPDLHTAIEHYYDKQY